jgi:hypothetical protein
MDTKQYFSKAIGQLEEALDRAGITLLNIQEIEIGEYDYPELGLEGDYYILRPKVLIKVPVKKTQDQTSQFDETILRLSQEDRLE